MIPKLIHYCWFGHKPLPELALKCIDSWKKFLPGYEIKEWNESNFDVDQIPYTAQAYKCGKYAFVSDYARFKIMYDCGGIYFDTDVEIIKNINDIIAKGAFWGMENEKRKIYCNPGLGFACPPHSQLCMEMIEQYKKSTFILSKGRYNLKTVVMRFSEILKKNGFIFSNEIIEFNGAHFYPTDFFSPIDYLTKKINITSNTRLIHHYAASWVNEVDNLSTLAKLWKTLHLPKTNIREKLSNILKENQ